MTGNVKAGITTNMSEFDAVQEARDAVATVDPDLASVVSWGAFDYYEALDADAKDRWKEAYLSELNRLGYANAPFQNAVRPI